MQMFPYGWQLPDGSVLRESVYAGMVAAANASYLHWVSPDERNAFLRKCGLPVFGIMGCSYPECRLSCS